MKKGIIWLAAAVLCLGLTSCSGQETEKSYEFSDETGIINGNFAEKTFQKESAVTEAGRTSLQLAGESFAEDGKPIFIDVSVQYSDAVSDAAEDARWEAEDVSSDFATDLNSEQIKKYGLSGYVVTYDDGTGENGSKASHYILEKKKKNGSGFLVCLYTLYYPGDEELITRQMDEIEFDWNKCDSLMK